MNEEPKCASLCSVHASPADGPACKCMVGRVGGAVLGGCLSIWHLRYSMQCNIFWKVPKIFIDAFPLPPVCFAFYLINDINANWG